VEKTDKTRALARAAKSLTEAGRHPAAFAAAILSRISSAEGLLKRHPSMAIDASSLKLSSRFLSYPDALEQFTASLARGYAAAGLGVEFAQTLETIHLADELVNLQAEPSRLADPEVFRNLAIRMAENGFAPESGRALCSTAVAEWRLAHRDHFPAELSAFVDQVTEALAAVVTTRCPHLGHSELWQALQQIRFIPQQSPQAI